MQLVVLVLGAAVVVLAVAVVHRFCRLVLRLELMGTQIQDVLALNTKALQSAGVLPREWAGRPVPSTWPPKRSAEEQVEELLGRARANAQQGHVAGGSCTGR